MFNKKTSELFTDEVVALLSGDDCHELRHYVTYLLHPLLQREQDFKTLKKKMETRFPSLSEGSVSGFQPKVWNWFKSFFLSNSSRMEEFLVALWLGPTIDVPQIACFQSNAFFRQVVQDIVEYDDSVFSIYLSLVRERFMPCLMLSAGKSQKVAAERAVLFEEPVDLLYDFAESYVEENISNDYALEDYSLSKDSSLWLSLPRDEIVPVAQTTYVRTYEMYQSLFFLLPCPLSSDQIAQDLSVLHIKQRRGDFDYYLSKVKLLQVDSISVWKNRIPLDVAVEKCWQRANGREEGMITNTEPDHSLNELVLCMHIIGGAFADVLDLILHDLFFVRQGWYISPNKDRYGSTWDPLLFRPAYNFFSCVAADPDDCCPYVLSASPSTVVRVPSSWGGSYLFTSRDLHFDTNSVSWVVLSPMIIARDRDYITISFRPHFSQCYLLCVDLNMELRGILALPDCTFDYSFDNRIIKKYPESLYFPMLPTFVRNLSLEEREQMERDLVYEVHNAINVETGDYDCPMNLMSARLRVRGGWKRVLLFPFLHPYLDTTLCPDFRFSIKTFDMFNPTARPSYSVFFYDEEGQGLKSRSYSRAYGEMIASRTRGDGRFPRLFATYNKASLLLLPYNEDLMETSSSYLLKHLNRCHNNKELIFGIFFHGMYYEDFEKCRPMLREVFGDEKLIKGVPVGDVSLDDFVHCWSNDSSSDDDSGDVKGSFDELVVAMNEMNTTQFQYGDDHVVMYGDDIIVVTDMGSETNE
jgi:hypothetical protein